MANKNIQIANFNCTFTVEDDVYPMMRFFNKIVYPAVLEESSVRAYKNNEYYLTDVKLIDLNHANSTVFNLEPEYALIGQHVRRVKLEIKQDFQVESGFIPVGKTEFSAPYSTFIMLLRNHRVIYFKDQEGSPEIRSLGATIRTYINIYRKKLVKQTIEEIQKNEYPDINISQIKGKSKTELKRYLNIYVYPEPEINIVPIPSLDVTESIMKKLVKIRSIDFRIYPLNSELDNSSFIRDIRAVAQDIKSPSGQVTFSGPKDISRVGEYIMETKGLADFTVRGQTSTDEKVILKPDEFVETIKVNVPDNISIEEQGVKVYQMTRNRPEIREVSDENQKNYKEYIKEKLN